MKKKFTFKFMLLLCALVVGSNAWGQAIVGTTLWSEDFSGYSANDVPSGDITNSNTGTTVYGGVTLTYACEDGDTDTKIYNDKSGPNTSSNNLNLLVSKKNGTFSISGISTGGAAELTLSYGMNGSGTLAVSSSTTGVSISGSTITTNGASTLQLTFKNTHNSKNLRIDDISVTVKTAGANVDVTGVTLSQSSATLTLESDPLQLTATVAPDNATHKDVTWESNNPSVATVSSTGLVTPVALGNATITATATNGTAAAGDDKTAMCTITVGAISYAVALADGTDDASNWTISPTSATAGQTINVSYSGTNVIETLKKAPAEIEASYSWTTSTGSTIVFPRHYITYNCSGGAGIINGATHTFTANSDYKIYKINITSSTNDVVRGNLATQLSGTGWTGDSSTGATWTNESGATEVSFSSSWNFNPELASGEGVVMTVWYKKNAEAETLSGTSSPWSFTMPAYDVELQVGYIFTVTLGDDNSTRTEASSGAGVTLPSRNNIGSYNFAGWSTTNVATETTTAPTIFAKNSVYHPTSDITLYPVYTREVSSISNVVDELDRAWTGISNGGGYGTWSGKSSNSSAVYAGQSAGGNDAIQLRTDNSNSGIVTTTSGGKAKKVVITWESNTSDGRTVDVYGKNTTAYSAATDLYNASYQGTKLGSIVYGTSTELTISGDYEYIGLRSNDKALYMSKVEITWTAGGTTTYYNSGYYMPITKWTSTTSGDGWYLIAAPVGTTEAAGIGNLTSNTYDLFRFNQEAEKEWENWNKSGAHYHFSLEEGRGYLYANSANGKLVFFDQSATNTTKDVTLTYSDVNPNTNLRGWNLIGNPFATTATIKDSDNNAKPFYRMNSDHTDLITGTTTGDVYALEGIFVHTDSGEDVTFTKKGSKGAANNDNSNLVIDLSGEKGNVIDRAIVRFDEGEALPKFQIKDNSTKLYIPVNGKDYAIVNANNQDELHMNFRASENGSYTLTVSESLSFSYLHLIDNIAGTDIDLLANPSYTFNAKPDDYESRFRLVFSANNENQNENEKDFAFFSNGQLIVTGEGTLQVVDMMGRIVSSEMVNGTTSKTIDAKAGIYVLQLINGENVKTQKIVVR